MQTYIIKYIWKEIYTHYILYKNMCVYLLPYWFFSVYVCMYMCMYTCVCVFACMYIFMRERERDIFSN